MEDSSEQEYLGYDSSDNSQVEDDTSHCPFDVDREPFVIRSHVLDVDWEPTYLIIVHEQILSRQVDLLFANLASAGCILRVLIVIHFDVCGHVLDFSVFLARKHAQSPGIDLDQVLVPNVVIWFAHYLRGIGVETVVSGAVHTAHNKWDHQCHSLQIHLHYWYLL